MQTNQNDAEQVAQLVLRERRSRDRGWWEEMAACFAETSIVDMSWFLGSGAEFVRRTRQASEGGVWGRHRLSPPTVKVNADRAWAELPLAIEFRIDVDGVEADLISCCRSQYRCQRADGAWKIVRITSIYERDTLVPSIPGTKLDIQAEAFTESRSSYRCLAWYLQRVGRSVRPDLLGDDQPAAVTRHYAAEHAWLTEPNPPS